MHAPSLLTRRRAALTPRSPRQCPPHHLPTRQRPCVHSQPAQAVDTSTHTRTRPSAALLSNSTRIAGHHRSSCFPGAVTRLSEPNLARQHACGKTTLGGAVHLCQQLLGLRRLPLCRYRAHRRCRGRRPSGGPPGDQLPSQPTLQRTCGQLGSERQEIPARPFTSSIFLDKNRRGIGKSQSTWNRFQDGNGRLTASAVVGCRPPRALLRPVHDMRYDRSRGQSPPTLR
jgi:hypothetical protein